MRGSARIHRPVRKFSIRRMTVDESIARCDLAFACALVEPGAGLKCQCQYSTVAYLEQDGVGSDKVT